MLRSDFQAEHGQYIPEDLCLCIENLPNRWTVSTWNDESLEALPEVEAELVEQVRMRLQGDFYDMMMVPHLLPYTRRLSSGPAGLEWGLGPARVCDASISIAPPFVLMSPLPMFAVSCIYLSLYLQSIRGQMGCSGCLV